MLRVYNTLSRSKEIFEPLEKNKISIYCCGITPYSAPHIGNARPFVTWDVIRRFFEKLGYKVRYVQNFTDIDDKIIAAANKFGMTWQDVSKKYIEVYFKTMDALNIRRADFYPKVSESIEDIIHMIRRLIEKNFAYVLENGDVFYSVEKKLDYGKLSGRKLEDMQAGARIEIDKRKRHPMDFALWKTAKNGEPAWNSPWGKGRPGWHIECSAMSLKFLGEKFDFHGGGSDLIFPHHENEIAQFQAALGDDGAFARYWIHNGFITKNDEKLSKSNEKLAKSSRGFFTIEEILQKYPGEVIRIFLIQTHYRNPLEFNEQKLSETQEFFNKLLKAHQQIKDLVNKIQSEKKSENSTNTENTIQANKLLETAEQLLKKFYDAMNDDFNAALAISHMFELAREIGIYYRELKNCHDSSSDSADKCILRVNEIFDEMADIIGIFEQDITDEKDFGTCDSKLIDSLMRIIISFRQTARQNKDWTTADKIRNELKSVGIAIEDTAQGATWKKV